MQTNVVAFPSRGKVAQSVLAGKVLSEDVEKVIACIKRESGNPSNLEAALRVADGGVCTLEFEELIVMREHGFTKRMA